MAELKPRREPTSPWPSIAIGVIGLGAVTALLWGGSDGVAGRPFYLTALLVAAELAATATASWTLAVAPRRLGYRVRGRELEVRTLMGRSRLPLDRVTAAEIVSYELAVPRGVRLGWPHSHMRGYYTGRYRLPDIGAVRAAVGARRGQGVLLELPNGRPWLLAPRDPDALLALVGRHAGATATRSASSRPGRRRR